LSTAKEDTFDHVDQLIVLGKERGYLLFEEVNDMLPPETVCLQAVGGQCMDFGP
jgi:hypothetical protein